MKPRLWLSFVFGLCLLVPMMFAAPSRPSKQEGEG